MKKIVLIILLTLSLFGDSNQTKGLSFFDEKDGNLDLSDYLSQAYGFLPVPTIITEPAVGLGLGVGLIYLHDNFTGKKLDSGRVVPASMSGVIAMGTENGTKFGGAFHIGYYYDDDLRTVSFVGMPNINIDTYTANGNAISSNMKGLLAYQAIKARILDTDLFLGAGYLYGTIDTTLDFFVPIKNSYTNAAFEIIMEYDARNSTLSPTSGYFINLKSSFYSESVGSDNNFEKYKANGFFYMPATDALNVNLKITGDSIRGDEAPFYAYPFISLRGMPVMKVQGEHVLSTELEVCWNFKSRWEALAFGGLGKSFGSNQFNVGNESFSSSKNHYTKGVGFRYLIAKKFGLKMGIDIASSEHDDAFYIQFGSAWAGF